MFFNLFHFYWNPDEEKADYLQLCRNNYLLPDSMLAKLLVIFCISKFILIVVLFSDNTCYSPSRIRVACSITSFLVENKTFSRINNPNLNYHLVFQIVLVVHGDIFWSRVRMVRSQTIVLF